MEIMGELELELVGFLRVEEVLGYSGRKNDIDNIIEIDVFTVVFGVTRILEKERRILKNEKKDFGKTLICVYW